MPRISARLQNSLFKSCKQEEGVENDEDEMREEFELGDEENFSTWTKEDTLQLMLNIKKQLKERDTFSYIRRIQLINWKKVIIDGKTELECKNRLQHLIKKIRHVRTLGEILSDVDIETIDVRKPKSAYALFCEEMKQEDLKGKNFFKEASKRFKALSDEVKASYEQESKRQSQMYKIQCPKGTRRKKITLTPLVLYIKHMERMGMKEGKDKLKREFATLEDKEKLKWINCALKANDDSDIDKVLNKDEQSLLRGEPKQPLNAFNLFIRKKSTEGKIDFKTATEAYRKLSKEEKDVFIEMSRKAKIQYKQDLATYLFSMPPDEQQKYLNKLGTPKQKRNFTKKVSKQEIDIEDDVDDVVDDFEENEQFDQGDNSVQEDNFSLEENVLQDEKVSHEENTLQEENISREESISQEESTSQDETILQEETLIPVENIESIAQNDHIVLAEHTVDGEHIIRSEEIVQAKNIEIGNIIHFNELGVCTEPIDVTSIKIEPGLPECNSNDINEQASKLTTSPNETLKSKLTEKVSKTQTTTAKSVDRNVKDKSVDSKSANKTVQSSSDSEKEAEPSEAEKKARSQKRKHHENNEDTSTVNSISPQKHKEKPNKKIRKAEEIESVNETGILKKIKVEEPERVASTPFYYYLQNIYKGKRKKAKKTYIALDKSTKRSIKKEFKRRHKEYLVKLEEYCESLENRKDLEAYSERIRREEANEMDTSDPDEYSS